MTATVLNLKKRSNNVSINIPIQIARQYANGITDELKDDFFAKLTEMVEANGPIHDRVWLEMICNWSPPDGLSLMAQAPWIKFAMRVDELDDSREGEFHLSPQDVERIWKRLIDPQFKVRRDAAFNGFLLDFLEATGKEFPEEA